MAEQIDAFNNEKKLVSSSEPTIVPESIDEFSATTPTQDALPQLVNDELLKLTAFIRHAQPSIQLTPLDIAFLAATVHWDREEAFDVVAYELNEADLLEIFEFVEQQFDEGDYTTREVRLSRRLNMMVEQGMLRRITTGPFSGQSTRYNLTPLARDLVRQIADAGGMESATEDSMPLMYIQLDTFLKKLADESKNVEDAAQWDEQISKPFRGHVNALVDGVARHQNAKLIRLQANSALLDEQIKDNSNEQAEHVDELLAVMSRTAQEISELRRLITNVGNTLEDNLDTLQQNAIKHSLEQEVEVITQARDYLTSTADWGAKEMKAHSEFYKRCIDHARARLLISDRRVVIDRLNEMIQDYLDFPWRLVAVDKTKMLQLRDIEEQSLEQTQELQFNPDEAQDWVEEKNDERLQIQVNTLVDQLQEIGEPVELDRLLADIYGSAQMEPKTCERFVDLLVTRLLDQGLGENLIPGPRWRIISHNRLSEQQLIAFKKETT